MPTYEALIQYRGGAAFRPGEVVCLLPAGSHWGECRTDPNFRIVRVQGLKDSETEALVAPEIAGSLFQAAFGTTPVRAIKLDVGSLGFADDRAADGIDLELDAAELMARASPAGGK